LFPQLIVLTVASWLIVPHSCPSMLTSCNSQARAVLCSVLCALCSVLCCAVLCCAHASPVLAVGACVPYCAGGPSSSLPGYTQPPATTRG
jgi:hypothetical protein